MAKASRLAAQQAATMEEIAAAVANLTAKVDVLAGLLIKMAADAAEKSQPAAKVAKRPEA